MASVVFTWKEDDPSARIILEGSFGLQSKTAAPGINFSFGLHAGSPKHFFSLLGEAGYH